MTKKISALTAVSAAAGANEIEVNEAGTSKKATLTQVKTLVQVGTTTNDSAAAGSVGELIESTLARGSATSLTDITAKTVTSISLTAGDWDVWGNVGFIPNGATTVSAIAGAINTTTDALPTAPASGAYELRQLTFATGAEQTISAGKRRISVASTTTVYLIAYSSFAVNTNTAYGYIGARRVR